MYTSQQLLRKLLQAAFHSLFGRWCSHTGFATTSMLPSTANVQFLRKLHSSTWCLWDRLWMSTTSGDNQCSSENSSILLWVMCRVNFVWKTHLWFQRVWLHWIGRSGAHDSLARYQLLVRMCWTQSSQSDTSLYMISQKVPSHCIEQDLGRSTII